MATGAGAEEEGAASFRLPAFTAFLADSSLSPHECHTSATQVVNTQHEHEPRLGLHGSHVGFENHSPQRFSTR